jgi:hypothetical protein
VNGSFNIFGQAGLFSAAVTAFTIESYQWLQSDPLDDTVLLLRQISQQIGNSTTGTAVLPPTPNDDFSVSPSSIRINIFWFLSLTISLSSVLLGITCKQWIQEHRRVTYTTSRKEALALSQLRDESLRIWGVPGLLGSLPVMLQVALVLFFAGILDLLWSLNHIVAALVSGTVGVVVLFVSATTVLPAYWLVLSSRHKNVQSSPPCPYKSPQSWIFYRFTLHILRKFLRTEIIGHGDWSRSDLYTLRSLPEESMKPRVVLGLRWATRAFSNTINAAIHIFRCLQDLSFDEAVEVLEQDQWTTLDALNFWYFTNLQCGWSNEIERFIAELYLRRVETPSTGSSEPANTLSPFNFIDKAGFFDLEIQQGIYL